MAFRNPLGYGMFRLHQNKSMALAHRAAWELAKGPIPDGMLVCHKCDNPTCVNIEHLFIGSHQDNAADKMSKGRWGGPPGDAHPRHLLPKEERVRIGRKSAATRSARGTQVRGEAHPRARLSRRIVAGMREMRSGGASIAAIAKRFGCGTSTAHRAVTGASWGE